MHPLIANLDTKYDSLSTNLAIMNPIISTRGTNLDSGSQ